MYPSSHEKRDYCTDIRHPHLVSTEKYLLGVTVGMLQCVEAVLLKLYRVEVCTVCMLYCVNAIARKLL